MPKREFDASKDVCIQDYGVFECGEALFQFGVYSYDGGEEKIGITRVYDNPRTGQRVHGKLGRLTWDEAHFIAEKITELAREEDA
jgi:hypothetical protein